MVLAGFMGVPEGSQGYFRNVQEVLGTFHSVSDRHSIKFRERSVSFTRY